MSDQYSSIFPEISSGYSHFTGAEKRVADYVLSHKEDVQYMSISELSDECGVGEATISRFCRRLKLKSYSEFKLALATSRVRQDQTMMAAVEEVSGEITQDDSISDLSRKLYAAHTTAIAQTMGMIRPSEIERAVDMMENANRVLCMGQGGSMILAMEAAHLMSNISSKYYAVQGSHLQATTAALMDERDVVLFFSYSGSTKEIVDLTKLAKEHGAKVILITRFLRSPGARRADVVLQCGADESPLQLGSVSAKMAQLYIVDVLYNELCRRNPEQARACQEAIAKALADKHL